MQLHELVLEILQSKYPSFIRKMQQQYRLTAKSSTVRNWFLQWECSTRAWVRKKSQIKRIVIYLGVKSLL